MSLIPAGTYPARATGEYEFGISESSGNEQVGLAFRITQGDHIGRVLSWYGFFNSEDNAKRTIKSLRACGWKGENLSDLSGITEQDVNIVVEIDDYDPENPRNKIAWVNGSGVAMKHVMNEQQKKALSARMRGLIVASGGTRQASAASRPPPQVQRTAPPRDAQYEDDIPF